MIRTFWEMHAYSRDTGIKFGRKRNTKLSSGDERLEGGDELLPRRKPKNKNLPGKKKKTRINE
jgi:hypothetical protein